MTFRAAPVISFESERSPLVSLRHLLPLRDFEAIGAVVEALLQLLVVPRRGRVSASGLRGIIPWA